MFLQRKEALLDQPQSQHPEIQRLRNRATLAPTHLYLDSTSSFHQVVLEESLSSVAKVNRQLRASCNAGTTQADEKGWCLGLFHVWLVQQGIANLLSLP